MAEGALPVPALPRSVRRLPGLRAAEPLHRRVQYRIGGPADWWWAPADPAPLGEALAACRVAGVAVTVLGAGSNALVGDGGIPGLVVRLPSARLRALGGGVVELPGGARMPRAAFDAADLGLGGLEFGVGIPGTAGAAAWGNAGAFGGEMAQRLLEVDLLTAEGGRRTLAAATLDLGYRSSALQRPPWAGAVVTAVRLQLRPADPAGLRAATAAIVRERRRAQPTGVRSLGSTFKNPPGDHAGRLLDACGLRGERVGAAQVSARHANFICNLGGASSADVLALAARMRHRVREQFGVELQLEIVPLGRPDPLHISAQGPP